MSFYNSILMLIFNFPSYYQHQIADFIKITIFNELFHQINLMIEYIFTSLYQIKFKTKLKVKRMFLFCKLFENPL